MNDTVNTIDYYFSDINDHPGISHEELNRKLLIVKLNSDNFVCGLIDQPKSIPLYIEQWEEMVKSGKRIHKMSKRTGKTQLENAVINNEIHKNMREAKNLYIESKFREAGIHILNCEFNNAVHYTVLERLQSEIEPKVYTFLESMKQEVIKINNEIAQANLKLVIKFAKEYQHVGVPLSDLIQEGNIGLMRAIEKFDISKGLKFTTYAVWWIKQGFLKVIKSNNRLIRIPTHIQETLSRISKAREIAIEATGNEPSMLELATAEGMTEEELETLYNVCMEPISIETVVAGEQAKQLKDFIPDTTIDLEHDLDHSKLAEGIAKALDACLTSAEKEVIIHRYGLFNETVHTLEEIASKMNKSRERIRQLEYSAKEKLKVAAPWLEDFNETS